MVKSIMFMDKIAAITARHWKTLLGFNLFVLVATVGAVAVSHKVWTATTKLILPDTSSHLDANLGTLGSLRNSDPDFSSTQVNPLNVQVSILTSDALLQRVRAFDPEKSRFLELNKYKSLFKVTPEEQSTIISVAVNGSSPEIARQRAIILTDAYQQRLNQLRQANSSVREQFSQKQLERAQQKFNQAQMELARFKQSTGLVNSEAQTQGIVTAINTLTTAQAQAVAQAQASANRVKVLSSRLNVAPDQANSSLGLSENPDYQYVRRQLAEVEANLVQARATYTDQQPKVQTLLSQRNQLQRQLQKYIAQAAAGTQVDTTMGSGTGGSEGRGALMQQLILAESEASAQQRQADKLQDQVEKLNKSLKALPMNQARLQKLQQESDVAEGVYKGLVAQVQQANIDAFNAYPNVQVLDPSSVDLKPTSPKLLLVAINAILASVIGSIALVLLLEGRNPLLSPKDLQTIKFPIVVSIPRFRQSSMGLQLASETEVEFQRLASAISLQSLKDHRLLVTSAIMGEGKTTVTLGVAKALADLGFRVLVVDGDFRQAQLSQCLGFTQAPAAANKPVQILPGLDVMPTLPKQGKIVELVTRGRFEQTLAAAQSAGKYDYVLVDSAPVSLTSETALMAAVIPNVLFVVRPGTSDRNSVNHSLEQLAQHNAQIVGLVINGVETKSKPYSYRSNGSLVKS